MARRCFYCGARAQAVDYGIPPWVPPLIGLAGAPVEHLVADEPPRREPRGPADQLPMSIPAHTELGAQQPAARLKESIDEAIKHRASLALEEYGAAMLCHACSEAVAALDERARPLLEPMMLGGAGRWGTAEQRTLAAWGARAAYAILSVERKSQGVPRSHRRSVLDHGEPQANVFVGYGRYRAPQIGVLAGRLLVPLGEDGAKHDVEAYSVLAVFGHMALKVFGVKRRAASTRVRPAQGQIVGIWPPRADDVSWPPIWTLSPQTLEHAFVQVPFYWPFRYSEVRYLGPGKKFPAKRKRTEGLRGRQ
jgi:hypothetical protein